MGTDYISCPGEGCPIKEKCQRFTGPKEPLWQSYFVEIPGEWIQDAEFEPDSTCYWKCDMFWGETQTSIMNQLNEIMK